jgi:hypothetical protein
MKSIVFIVFIVLVVISIDPMRFRNMIVMSGASAQVKQTFLLINTILETTHFMDIFNFC